MMHPTKIHFPTSTGILTAHLSPHFAKIELVQPFATSMVTAVYMFAQLTPTVIRTMR